MVPSTLKRKLATIEAKNRKGSKKKRGLTTTKKKQNKTTKKASSARSTSKKKDPTRSSISKPRATSNSSNAPCPANGNSRNVQGDARLQGNNRRKVERSPNGRARCQKCRQIIKRGEIRVGIPISSASAKTTAYQYYHNRCLSDVHKPGCVKETHSQIREKILSQRANLLWNLQQYWSLLGTEKIHKLVIALPQNERDLFKVLGATSSSFPYDHSRLKYLLDIIRKARQKNEAVSTAAALGGSTAQRQMAANSSRRTNDPSEVIVIDDTDDEDEVDMGNKSDSAVPEGLEKDDRLGDDDDDDDGEVLVGGTLSCAQVIQQKFDQAAANGEILTID
ncbi:unnamed protein product [Pseudo-nitzschia multistriata]|uniref:PARP-type domain-containing protein n=1 Tax=Pseudo-nitzschia multistriata TaxID=183589 RepID=A0A448ZRY0_9STRA|nr:unnamed protein product [Pseudo-nitzschia multistriata]